jgi:hypothetical protein
MYNASAVKIHNTTSSVLKINIFFYIEKNWPTSMLALWL